MSGDTSNDAGKSFLREHFTSEILNAGDHAVVSGQNALKSLFLANGAAIISLLTFIGNKSPDVNRVAIFWSFVWFASGLVMALMAQLSLYRSMANLAGRAYELAKSLSDVVPDDSIKRALSHNRRSQVWLTSVWIAATGAIAFFIAGVFVALNAIT